MADRTLLEFRSRVLKGVRDFFHSRGYLEVETPILAPGIIPEAHLDYFHTTFSPNTAGLSEADTRSDDDTRTDALYLTPSPEIWLKQLLARGWGSLFEISRAFRNGEQTGRQHNPEFTMLEWYTLEAEARDNIPVTEALLQDLAKLPLPPGSRRSCLNRPLEIIPMREAFHRWAGLSLRPDTSRRELYQAARRGALPAEQEDSWEVLFNLLFLTLVEPEIPEDRPVILTDYPRQIPTLAAPSPEGWSQRWELYLGGMEAANCYTEERDPQRIAEFFRREKEDRRGDCRFPPSLPGLEKAMTEMPPCSGAAMGVDRLVAALLGKTSLEGVILFPFPDILP